MSAGVIFLEIHTVYRALLESGLIECVDSNDATSRRAFALVSCKM